MVDFGEVLRRARENAAETGGYRGYRGNRESDPQDIKGLAEECVVTTETSAVDTGGYRIENGNHSNPSTEVVTSEWIPRNTIDNNELECEVSTVTTVITQKSNTPADPAGSFLAAIRTIWPEARMLTQAEQDEDAQFREQLILVREENAKVYANPTPWARK